MDIIPQLQKVLNKDIKHTTYFHFKTMMNISLTINEFIIICNSYKKEELIDKEIIKTYWVKVMILLINSQEQELYFNYFANVSENVICCYNDKILPVKFIFLNFLGSILSTYIKYDILTWYKIGKIIGIDVDTELKKLL
jgi:hypothetical protein